jgi:hypothetical protein
VSGERTPACFFATVMGVNTTITAGKIYSHLAQLLNKQVPR